MRLHTRLVGVARRTPLPRRTVRLRLTLLYGTLFLVSGAALLTVTDIIVGKATNPPQFAIQIKGVAQKVAGSVTKSAPSAGQLHGITSGSAGGAGGGPPVTQLIGAGGMRVFGGNHVVLPAAAHETARQLGSQVTQVQAAVITQHAREIHLLVVASAVALGVMALLSIVLGWLVAGRVLRPLRTITNTAREISATNLHRRLDLDGPDDELKELGDTFDALLRRLERSFDSQRRFVANASHELRTPLARQRTLAQVALSDPDASMDSLRHAHERVLATGEQEERLIEALLTLSRSQSGLEHFEPFDLAQVAGTVLDARPREENGGIAITASLATSAVSGDPRLAERLVSNLIDNAVRHNVDEGWVKVTTARQGDAVHLTVANSGPHLEDADLSRVLEPFQRLGVERVARRDDGVGLGLSIVKAVADAHGAQLTLKARREGGLVVDVTFVAPPVMTVVPGSAIDTMAAELGPTTEAKEPVLAGH